MQMILKLWRDATGSSVTVAVPESLHQAEHGEIKLWVDLYYPGWTLVAWEYSKS